MNKYVEHIISDLVRDTRIDYEIGRIYFPFSPHSPLFFPPLLSYSSLPLSPISFSKYCKDTFGLTEEEIEYVWDQYRSIIKEKISNRES